jgi:hypothetical protein
MRAAIYVKSKKLFFATRVAYDSSPIGLAAAPADGSGVCNRSSIKLLQNRKLPSPRTIASKDDVNP